MRKKSTVVSLTVALLIAGSIVFVSESSLSILAQQESTQGEKCDKGLERCVAEKRKEWADRGTLGMLVHPLNNEDAIAQGARWIVHEVMPGGAAHKAGLLAGDLLVEWKNKEIPLDDLKFLDDAFEKVNVGDELTIEILREGKAKTMLLTAMKPSGSAIEYWLLFYVHENFDDTTFRRYQSNVEVRLTRSQRE